MTNFSFKLILISLFLVILLLGGCKQAITVGKPTVKTETKALSFEARVEQKICAEKTCIKAYQSVETSNMLDYVLIGSTNIKGFIEEKHLASGPLNENLSYLEVKQLQNGQISEIEIIIPTQANNSNAADKINICKKFNVKCKTGFIIPDKNQDISSLINAGCTAAFLFAVPDPVDLVCIITLANQ